LKPQTLNCSPQTNIPQAEVAAEFSRVISMTVGKVQL